MNLWWELLSLLDEVSLSEEEDHIVWNYTSSGRYEVQSLYAVISFRGVAPIYVSSVWKLRIPPRVQFFLWLVSNNRVLTRDNLAKRREVSDPTCLLCNEMESVTHLFFECCVAKLVWSSISDLLGVNLGESFESVAHLWLANKRHELTNVFSSSVIWSIWKLRNEICFQGVPWTGIRRLLLMVVKMTRRWVPMLKQELGRQVEELTDRLEKEALLPRRIEWNTQGESSSQLGQLAALHSDPSAVSLEGRNDHVCNDELRVNSISCREALM